MLVVYSRRWNSSAQPYSLVWGREVEGVMLLIRVQSCSRLCIGLAVLLYVFLIIALSAKLHNVINTACIGTICWPITQV